LSRLTSVFLAVLFLFMFFLSSVCAISVSIPAFRLVYDPVSGVCPPVSVSVLVSNVEGFVVISSDDGRGWLGEGADGVVLNSTHRGCGSFVLTLDVPVDVVESWYNAYIDSEFPVQVDSYYVEVGDFVAESGGFHQVASVAHHAPIVLALVSEPLLVAAGLVVMLFVKII